MIHDFPAFVAGFALCLLLLVLFHILFDKTIEEVRYCLGAGSICTGCSLSGLILGDERLMFGPWIITFAGLVVIGIQYAERQIEKKKLDAKKSGEIVGLARRYAQELDRNAESGLDAAERHN